MSLSIVILAAGQGTRMNSRLPKVLHYLAGKTLLEHVYAAVVPLDFRQANIVYGYGGESVPQQLSHLEATNWIEQKQQLGTGHAVQQVVDHIPDEDDVLILYGDVPLITFQTLQNLVEAGKETGFALLTCHLENPHGYGRIIRDEHGNITKIVEHKDATEDELDIHEINTGMMALKASLLKLCLSQLQNNNAQGEYYLTDIIELAVAEEVKINSCFPDSEVEICGVNDRAQLADLERYYQMAQAHYLMQQGLTLRDPERFDLRGELEIGQDVVIDVNVIIEGSASIGSDVDIGPNCVIKNADIGDGVVILANCVIENAVIGDNCRIGPFSRVRPHTRLARDVHVGNFVEVKNSEIGENSKANHLSYIGDTEIGKDSNIGAGTITCNYDGANKHRTIIGDNVHIGSDTQLVAPVKIGNNVTIGAGTTVTKDVDADQLIHNKSEQRTVKGWERPKKK